MPFVTLATPSLTVTLYSVAASPLELSRHVRRAVPPATWRAQNLSLAAAGTLNDWVSSARPIWVKDENIFGASPAHAARSSPANPPIRPGGTGWMAASPFLLHVGCTGSQMPSVIEVNC